MVRHENERSLDIRQMFNGEGQARMRNIREGAEELCGKGRIFTHLYLDKNCEVGWHIHQGDCEIYYILKGEGEYNDNGKVVTVRPGDVTFVDDGEGHGLLNKKDETLEAIALILYTT